MQYDEYNREERYLCAHLFRLLHEWISGRSDPNLFASFLEKSGLAPAGLDLKEVKVYCEVALIRDAYESRKQNVADFMDKLVNFVADQEGETEFRTFSKLVEVLRIPKKTHPDQVFSKAQATKEFSGAEQKIYGAVRGMFHAKPDLAITTNDYIIAYEAKYTEKFANEQYKRTHEIADVWAKLLYEDLGFDHCPKFFVAKIGNKKDHPNVSWQWLLGMAKQTYQPGDRTIVALSNAVSLLSGKSQLVER